MSYLCINNLVLSIYIQQFQYLQTMKATNIFLFSIIMFQICNSGVIFVSQDEGPLKGTNQKTNKNQQDQSQEDSSSDSNQNQNSDQRQGSNYIQRLNSRTGEQQTKYRIMVSSKNAQFINNWNSPQNKDKDKQKFKLGPNSFMTLTNDQFKQLMLTLRPSSSTASSNPEDVARLRARKNAKGSTAVSVGAVTSSDIYIDWRQFGFVSSVKNQGSCGSCWAFNAVSDIQSRFLEKGKSINFSQQQLVDCSTTNGCGGGWTKSAFNHVQKNKLARQKQYPYQAKNQQCNTSVTSGNKIKRSFQYNMGSDCSMAQSLIQLRPIAIAISAGSQFFQSYSSGVLTKCGTTLDHGVNLVGLVQNSVDNYWIVKNSWGVGWGEKGYVRIARNSATGPNLCLVCSYPMYSSLV